MKIHYKRKWVKLFFTDAITFGENIYTWKHSLSLATIKHEKVHVEQYRRYGKFGFLRRYFWQWISHGFRYSKIHLEQEAEKARKEK